ncbi:MAG: 4a-hydroxytetrahydrobiopterin dehydratase [Steroidobacteraceae bacterium]
MTTLAERTCKPCEGGVAPLSRAEAQAYLAQVSVAWTLTPDAHALRREFAFKDFYRTMSFVNALAHVANIEDHHPDLEVGYNYCRVTFTTHAIKGLSENDFVCAAKVDRIPLNQGSIPSSRT